MPSIKFDITGDNKQLVESLHQAQQVIGRTIVNLTNEGKQIDKTFDDASRSVDKTGDSIENTLKKIGKGVAAYFAVSQVKDFIGEVMNVRKEFEQLQISFSTLLGSDVAGTKMFNEITEFATTTPMLEKDLASAAQTMLGFNIEAEKVMPLLKQMGDISMGDSQKLQSLSLAFSQAASTGKLMGQDLLQMINAGFNPLAEISRTTGRSLKDLKDDMANGKISIEMLEGAFKSATEEGGKFHGMLNSMAESAQGAFSNLEGAMQKFYNEMGTLIEQPLVEGTNAITSAFNFMAENAQGIVSALSGLIASVGTYKAACLIAAQAIKGWTIAEQVHYTWLLLVEKAQKMLNATMLTNPYILAATAIAGVVAALVAWKAASKDVSEEQERLNKASENLNTAITAEKAKIDDLFSKLRNAKKGTTEYKDAKEAIINQYGQYLSGLSAEVSSLNDVEAAYKAVTRAANEAARARAMEGAKGEAQKAFGDSLTKTNDNLYKILQRRLSPKDAKRVMQELNNELATQGAISEKTIQRIQKSMHIDQLADNLNENMTFVRSYIGQMNTAQKKLQDAYNNIEATMGGTDPSGQQTANEQKNKKALEEKKKNLQATLDALSPEKAIGKEGEKIKKQIQQLDKQINDAYGTTSAKAAAAADKRAAKAAERLAKEEASNAQKVADAQIKANDAASRAKTEAMLQTRQYEIDQMEEGSKRTIAQIKLDYDKEKAAIVTGIEDMKKANEEAARQLWEAQNPDAGKQNMNWDKYKETNNLTFGLTEEQKAMFKARESANEASLNRSLDAERKRIEQFDIEYLKNYGTREQKRYAIEKEWNDKIAELQKQNASEAQINTAKEEKKLAISNYDTEQFKKSIDWETIYGNLDNLDKVTLENVKGQLERFIETAKDLSPSDIKDVQNALENINTQIDMKDVIGAYKKAKKEAEDAIKEVADANAEVANAGIEKQIAEDTYNQAVKDLAAAQAGVDAAKQSGDWKTVAAATYEYSTALEQVNTSKEKVTESTDRLKKAEDRQEKAVKKSNSATIKVKKTSGELRSQLGELASGLNSLGGAIGGVAGQWVQFGASTLSASVTAMNGIQKIKDGVKGLEQAIAILAIIQASLEVLQTMSNLLGIGVDKEAEKAEKLKAQYEEMSKVWDDLIDKKKEYIDISYGDEAQKAYEDSMKYLKAQEEMARSNAQQVLDVRNGGHSMEKRMWNGSYVSSLGRTWSNVAGEINKSLGTNIRSMQDFTKLSSEQLLWIKENYVDLWGVMDGSFKDYLENIITYGDKAKELGESLQKSFTGISLDDFYSSYEDMLTDMDSDNETFADNFSEYLKSAILKSMLAKEYKEQIEALYAAWEAAAESGNLDNEIDNLQQRQSDLTESILKRREELMKQYGLSSEDGSNTLGFDLDGFKSDFQSLISDLTNTSKEFADTFGEYMKNALINSMIESKYSDQLKELYDNIAQDAKDGRLDEQAIDTYKNKYLQLTEAAQKEAEAIEKITANTKDLLQSSVSELQSSLTAVVTDMEKQSSDFAQAFKDYLKSALNNTLSSQFSEQIKALYEEINHAVNVNNGVLDEQTIKSLEQTYTLLANQMQSTARQYSQLLDTVTSNFDTSFDTLKSDFVSLFSDLDKTADDFAKKFQSYMTNAFANAIWKNGDYATLMGDLMDDIQASMSRNGGMLTEDEIKSYQKVYQDYVTQAQEQMKVMSEVFKEIEKSDYLNNSLETMKSNYKSIISDLDKTNEDFAESFGEYLRSAMIDNAMTDALNDQLSEFYDSVSKYAEGGLTADEVEELRRKYQELCDTGQKAVEDIDKIIGSTKKYLDLTADGLKGDFKSLLSDAETEVEDFSKKVKEYIYDALINKVIVEKYTDELTSIINDMESYIVSGSEQALDSAISKAEIVGSAIKTLSDSTKKALGLEDVDSDLQTFQDEFEAMVSNMDNTSKDFADNMGNYIRNALIKNLIASTYAKRIQELYEMFANYQNEGTLQEHIAELKDAQQALANEIRQDVNNINSMTGYISSSQTASSAFQGMSEDTGEELNGRFTAIQISNEKIAESITATLSQMESITKATSEGNAYLQDILLQQTLANGHLENILKCNKSIYSEFGSKIDRLINKL